MKLHSNFTSSWYMHYIKKPISGMNLSLFDFCCGSPIDVGSIVNGIADAVRGKEYDSPPYTVVATHEVGSNSFEERNYEGGKNWACVNNANSDNRMFMTLFGYISGANVGNKEID